MSALPTSIFSLTNHEVFLLTAKLDQADCGMIATYIMPATLVPDRLRIVAVLSPQNQTVDGIRENGRFTVQLLSQEQSALVPQFGLYSGKERDKFSDVALERSPSGMALIKDSCGWIECKVVDSMDSGDRIIFLADVAHQKLSPGIPPLRKVDAFSQLPLEAIQALLEKRRRDGERDRELIKQFD